MPACGIAVQVPSIRRREWRRARTVSLAIAMRALTAVVILAACSLRFRAHAANASDVTDIPVRRLAQCARSIGPTKCLSALASYRAENAISCFKNKKHATDFAKDAENFPWELYANNSDDKLYTQLCAGTEKLLKYRPLNFDMIPGYEVKLLSNGNGTLSFDLFDSESSETSRGMKKMRKLFYNIVPYLLLPGLIMAAVLPFVLPALKMTTVAVSMLNNMALSGAIFTLLRNNAFNDKYDKKVVYVNEGYHNEKHAKHNEHHSDDDIHFDGHQSEHYEQVYGEDFDIQEETPTFTANSDWINQYYGNTIKVARKDYRREGGIKRS